MIKDKELRLALVCYGGVSLAVYMFGIIREFHKLLRASKYLHTIRDPGARRSATFTSAAQTGDPELDTEAVYFELLQELGQHIDVRVFVDIIAGASAGGINGVMLAQAVTQDVSLAPLRALWLENADVDRLLDPDAASTRWSKIYMRPLVWLWSQFQSRNVDEVLGRNSTMEMRMKLSRFVRSRWFKPPFSGTGFATMLYEALDAMGTNKRADASLLPPGYPFDLFVTVTDYYGRAEHLRLHSPREIVEREHRLVIGFNSDGADADGRRSLGSIASLAFAARATASFPGAFPPAQLAEIDTLLARRSATWPDRATFISTKLGELTASGADAETAAFIDGSVLNNKPFGEAIAALRMRPAHREVDRRIVYIEPFPARETPGARTRRPGFFTALKAALSDIPRTQPIRDDLEWVQSFSTRVRRFKQVLGNMTDEVEEAVQAVVGDRLDVDKLTVDALIQWRDIAHQAAAEKSGFAYGAYAELKVLQVLDDCAALLAHVRGGGTHGAAKGASPALCEAVHRWAEQQGIIPVVRAAPGRPVGEYLPWVHFLRGYDAGFRIRRLRFVIRRLNEFYARETPVSRVELDTAKGRLYQALGRIRTAMDTAGALDAPPDAPGADVIAPMIERLRAAMNLTDVDDHVDQDLVAAIHVCTDASVRRALVLAYLGFPFYDILALPMLRGDGLDEFDEIKVDRISAEDANALDKGSARDVLKGVQMGMFGAFFSRSYRENDYLWGRLHAADRLVDIVLSAAEESVTLEPARIMSIKRKLFWAILSAETPHLPHVQDLIRSLQDRTAALA